MSPLNGNSKEKLFSFTWAFRLSSMLTATLAWSGCEKKMLNHHSTWWPSSPGKFGQSFPRIPFLRSTEWTAERGWVLVCLTSFHTWYPMGWPCRTNSQLLLDVAKPYLCPSALPAWLKLQESPLDNHYLKTFFYLQCELWIVHSIVQFVLAKLKKHVFFNNRQK